MSTRGGSALFSGFRVLGLYSNHVPHALRYHQKHREFYVLTSVGKCFHTYNVSRLGIVSVSNSMSEDISCLAADRMLVFAAAGHEISAFARNKEVVQRYHGHQQEVRLLLPLGDQLVSADVSGDVIVWDVQSAEIYLRLQFDPMTFDLSAMMHPSTYLNKVLLGSRQGPLQLWNIKTSKLVFTFPGWSTGVTVLEQSPAVDVVGIGTATGRIIIHNIRLDETLMSFTQDWGPITALAFRTDGAPVLASCSPQGHVAFWDLDRCQMLSQLSHAHHGAVAGATFVHGEPLLVTNGGDNALKAWLMEEGGARLLRCRQGHSAPPTSIRHHGNDGKNILSAGLDGTLQSFSTVHERFNKNLGHGSINKKKEKKKKHGLKHEELRLPPISSFCSAWSRQSDWDSVVSCHRGRRSASTWNYQRCTTGRHHLRASESSKKSEATAVDITSCGHFALIGSSCGRVDVFNLQSGFHRGNFTDTDTGTAHRGVVRGVATDLLNQLTVTVGSDCLLRFWRFKSKKLEHELELPSSPSSLRLHRDSGMLALALDDFSLLVVDMETRRVVRKFTGHHGNVTDTTFSPDGRWLISVSMDCTVRTWDLPSGSLVDCFLVGAAPVSVSLSPTGDFLATAHVDSLGLFLWTNRSLCGPVGLRPLPSDFQPTNELLPCVQPEEEELLPQEDDDAYVSHEQLGAELVTLSLLPESRWRTLLQLDAIKKRNKPKAPPAAPAAAPFFLPTIPGLTPQFSVPTATDVNAQSKVMSWGALGQRSEFSRALEDAMTTGTFSLPVSLLRGGGPSFVSLEISDLSAEGGVAFLHMIDSMLQSGRDFDLAHGYLALFLKTHLKAVSCDPIAMETLLRLSTRLEKVWAELRNSFDQSLCLLSYTKSALL